MVIDFSHALIDLVLHEIINPQAHVDVVFEHEHDHAVEREPQVILRYVELPQLFVQLSQLFVALVDQVERASANVI